MVRKAEQVHDLRDFARAVDEFGEALTGLSDARPPEARQASPHREIARMTRRFEQATGIVRKAVQQNYMSGAQYHRIAAHFEAIAKDMEKGAAEESGLEQRSRARRTPAARPAPRTRRRTK